MTTATETKPTAKTTPNGAIRDKASNLYQRLSAITADVAVKATGKTAFGSTITMSITDIERALGDLTAQHGVVTGYRWNEKPEQQGSLWLANLTVWLVNADNPDDKREETVYDVGNSPSAAVSYAIKRYYRALFHLADEQDEQRSVSTGNGSARFQASADAARSAPSPSSPHLTPEQTAELTALNASLPKPVDEKPLSVLLRDLPYDTARNSLGLKHQQQCGPDCGHLAKP